MAKLLQPEEVIYMHRAGLTHAVDIVPREVNKHDVLGPILLGCKQLCAPLFIL